MQTKYHFFQKNKITFVLNTLPFIYVCDLFAPMKPNSHSLRTDKLKLSFIHAVKLKHSINRGSSTRVQVILTL